MISLIIPAHNEHKYLNQTIENFISTAKTRIEVIVVLNGYEQEVDNRAIVIRNTENLGMRNAVNRAARIACGDYLMITDAHCNISQDWDIKMLEVLEKYPKGIAVAPITAINKDWSKGRGFYAFCDLTPKLEPKWHGKKEFGIIEKNMGLTGCGLMLSKDFYFSWGGLDESLAPMGAIGAEFSIHAWLDGDGIYTRTDILLGHIFDTGGYDTSKVNYALKTLYERYGHRYQEIVNKYSGKDKVMGINAVQDHRTIVIERKDEHVTTDNATKKPIKKVVEIFKYVFEDDGNGPSEAEITEKYKSEVKKVEEQVYYPTEDGGWSRVA